MGKFSKVKNKEKNKAETQNDKENPKKLSSISNFNLE